ncbi:MAG: FxsA family protein [Actinomycetota bacterium]|nr:FxsA family protein [Actinomycetota bacterium]
MGFLAAALVAVTVAEIVVLVLVEARIGLLATLLLILATAVLGAYLLTRQGLGVAKAFRADLQRGVFPGRRVAEGALILVGGAFLATPGLLTDSLGLLLMVPAVREGIRRWAAGYFRRRFLVR